MAEAARAFDLPFELSGRRIWVAGHQGMVGSALMRRLPAEDPAALITAGRHTLDLTRQDAVDRWMDHNRPDVVILAAAKVGGILANSRQPADFLYDNLMIAGNVVHAAARTGVDKLLFLASSCIYPKFAPQPIAEDALMTGPLEPTNEWYALAKIAGVKLCQAYRLQGGHDFISAMPTNLYGPGDNYDLASSHVLPALIRKMHEAVSSGSSFVDIWGTGTPRREFLHVDDLADACVHLLKHHSGPDALNVGSGSDISIRELAETVARVVGFDGQLRFDTTKPDGTPRKWLDSSRLRALGWQAERPLEPGIADAYDWFLRNAA